MNDYTKGALDTIKMVREVIVETENTPIDLPTALSMLEEGVKIGGELRDRFDKRRDITPDLLAVCEKLAEADKLAFPDGTMYIEYIDVVAEAREMARAVMEKLKEQS